MGRFGFLLVALALTLGSCGYKAERAQLRVGPDLMSDFTVVVSRNSPTKTPEDIKGADEVVANLEKCTAGSASWMSNDKSTTYRLVRNRVSSIELQKDIADCLGPYKIRTETKEGILSDTYSLYLELPITLASDDDHFAHVPKVISVSMPGNDIEIRDASTRRLVKFDIEKVSASEATFTLHPDDAAVKLAIDAMNAACPPNQKGCSAEKDRLSLAPLKIEITSVHYKYGFNELMAILGLLFGSGVVLGIRRYVVAKRR